MSTGNFTYSVLNSIPACALGRICPLYTNLALGLGAYQNEACKGQVDTCAWFIDEERFRVWQENLGSFG